MLAYEGLFDQSGHVSVRRPETGQVLIHPHSTPRLDVRAEDLVTIDLDGRLVEGDQPPPSELFIHTRIYRARPDVQAVVHAHSRMATVFGIAGVDIVPVTNNATLLGPGPVPTYPDPRLVRSPQQGDALARMLGQGRACVMRNHGSVVVGSSLRDAFVAALFLEENALRQHLALQIGRPSGFTQQEMADMAGVYDERPLQKTWDHYVSRARHAGLA